MYFFWWLGFVCALVIDGCVRVRNDAGRRCYGDRSGGACRRDDRPATLSLSVYP